MMKRILMVVAALMVALGLGAGSAQAATFSSSNSGSCSGTVQKWGYFYAYTYQYAYISNGKIENENHNFNFNGFLDGAEKARLLEGRDSKWIVYRSGDFDLAVPYVKGAGLFVRDNRVRGSDYIKLCSY
ncbi:hypothetical protein [Nocardia sp. NPDC052566]|uniref:hypothetical protein n=1 Tax=Nocardia sp. NPDC052566 TaxID=3364330 RepID=UPI0037C993C5